MNPKDKFVILYAAHSLLSDPKYWVKGSYAKSSQVGGVSVSFDSEEATCWCASGVLSMFERYFNFPKGTARRLKADLAPKCPTFGLISTNDSFGREAVLEVFLSHLEDLAKIIDNLPPEKTDV